MLADIAVIRALAATQSRQAADLDVVAATLRSVSGPAYAAAFGPVGERFLTALTEAIDRETRVAAGLSERMAAAAQTAAAHAAAYDDTEGRAGRSITAAGT